MTTTSADPDLRQHLLAVFVAFHLTAMVVVSFPAPSRSLLADEPSASARELLAPWVAAGARVGLDEDAVRGVARGWSEGVRAVHGAFYPYTHYLGALQGWTMFGHITAESALPEIEMQRDGRWEPVYVARSTEHAWRRSLFDHDRVRTWLHEAGWKGHSKGWSTFADWALREVSADFDGVEAVRVQFVPVHIPDPVDLRVSRSLEVGRPERVEVRRP
ncbi:MAG: hypothetical protein H6738_14850 [Alphaproteobacteria bacterium]|nr:hypothetical protein [Alphaproteobacteria bacterium]MCB9698055.1 hypothetical protein [Alphaproteobacteria bacterium]